jgi:deoxyuridine 5'-triphosphate nucleotidohydrolase
MKFVSLTGIRMKKIMNTNASDRVENVVVGIHPSPDGSPDRLFVKRLTPTAVLPTRADPQSAGLDVYYSGDDITLLPNTVYPLPTGIAVQVPPWHYGRIAPRSGLAIRHGIQVLAGVIDASYRGEIVVIVTSMDTVFLKQGNRIAQLIIEKILVPVVVEVNDLTETTRGASGFGSSGR